MGVWIETPTYSRSIKRKAVTPCVGVWIETVIASAILKTRMSHPAWVCGLKLSMVLEILLNEVTPCVGVWIETPELLKAVDHCQVTPCVGVWIETGN